MRSVTCQPPIIFALALITLMLTSCTAGNPQFTADTPAGFWWGLWHGMISIISLIIHLFNESVVVYELHNSGPWYDFGFLLGIIAVWGGGCHAGCKSKQKKRREDEWQQVADKVEKKVLRKLRAWAEQEESDESDREWQEIRQRVEKKLKRKLREWAEQD